MTDARSPERRASHEALGEYLHARAVFRTAYLDIGSDPEVVRILYQEVFVTRANLTPEQSWQSEQRDKYGLPPDAPIL